jgi:hypothetical protein
MPRGFIGSNVCRNSKVVNGGQDVNILHALVKDIIEEKTFSEGLCPRLDLEKSAL